MLLLVAGVAVPRPLMADVAGVLPAEVPLRGALRVGKKLTQGGDAFLVPGAHRGGETCLQDLLGLIVGRSGEPAPLMVGPEVTVPREPRIGISSITPRRGNDDRWLDTLAIDRSRSALTVCQASA